MAISSPGIGSNLDVNSIVTKLMTTEQGPLNLITQKQTDVQTKISAFGTVSGALSTFQTTVSALSSASKFNAETTAVSDSTMFSATANGKASVGSYAVTVRQLAQVQKLALAGFSSATDTVGTGTLTITFGSYAAAGNTFTPNANNPSASISITPANNTLEGVRDAINAANAGVSASIVNDGSANGNRLVVTSKLTGVVNSIKITVADGDGNNLDNAGLSQLAYDPTATSGNGKNLSELQAAKDALLTIDGISVTKSSNVISDAVEGITLNLLKEDINNKVTLSVAKDTTTIKNSVSAFVDAYNALNQTLRALTNYNPTTNTGGPLVGDATTRSIATQIKSIITGNLGNGNSLTSLSQIGVAFQRNGTLALDSTKLQSSIDNNFSQIAALFSTSGNSTDAQIKFLGNSSKTQAGNYPINVSQLATQGALLGAAAPNLNIQQGVNDQLNLSIDGRPLSITLTAANYSSATDLASEIQTRIAATGLAAKVTVSGSALQIQSNNYGSNSSVVLNGGTAASDLLGPSPTATTGLDVTGTINGIAATGRGQVLLGAIGDASHGLLIQVTGGATGARGYTNFATGFAYQLNSLTTSFLGSGGLLQSKTAGLNSSIKTLTKNQQYEQNRLVAIEKRYRAQFTALDVTIASMQSTSTFLTQQLAQFNKQTTG